MKKSSFVAMILGTISVVFFALGMCMTMLPEWNAFKPGVVSGSIGIVFALITIFVWRKMEHKEPIKINPKTIGTALLGMVGALALGIGMCYVMIWSNLILGVVIGLVGIIILMSLIPIIKGLK
ncbi:hypothetical protein KHM83_16765 [Fusibacter paucivorans]|uniref:Uncharacterized protein n=1 Tax=Fusibacter paucivorans TaxID=76009 RepID=A0ABS5PT46_9FIRM|nr:hypothetical protein [Fusibacter paucivorans]MBS7528344.1 hypothetical protein [Fusibacter paucivorans]